MSDSSESPAPDSPDSETEPSPENRRHAQVRAAMAGIQNRQPGWSRAIILLVVSLVLFAGAGALDQAVRFLGVLIAVLFVHDLGHFLAMRWFGCRNVRIFFIPFFGAAVSGQNFNVAGWKKVVVSLMGPVPGIALGTGLGYFAWLVKQNPEGFSFSHELLLEIATVCVVINGFNLLPILPLDGGWVMHALIFCRHPVFDAGFRLLASLAMLLLGAATNEWFFLFIGGFLLLGLPITHRMAKLARRLRSEGVLRDADSEDDIPIATAERIIDGVDEATRHAASAQIVASHSLQVFETLNTKPPGLFASVIFGTLHAACLVLSVATGIALIVEKNSSFEDFWDLWGAGPKSISVCETAETWTSPGWKPGHADESLLLIAHRSTERLATDEFQELTKNAPADGQVVRFGQTLLVDVKDEASHKAWKKKLKTGGNVLPSGRVSVRVHCTLPSFDRASHAVQDCEHYAGTGLSCVSWLMPPWAQPDNLTDAGRERLRRARQTFLRVREKERELGAQAGVGDDYKANIDEATLAKDEQRALELLEQLHKEQMENLEKSITEIRRTVSSPVETQVLNLMLEHELATPLEKEQPEPPHELADLLGRFVPDVEGRIPFAASRCFDVEARQGALLVDIKVEAFESTTVGLTRLSHWLCEQGAPLIQYEITTEPPVPNVQAEGGD